MDPFHAPQGSMSCRVLELMTNRKGKGKSSLEGFCVFDTASVSQKDALAQTNHVSSTRADTLQQECENKREANRMRWKSKTY